MAHAEEPLLNAYAMRCSIVHMIIPMPFNEERVKNLESAYCSYNVCLERLDYNELPYHYKDSYRTLFSTEENFEGFWDWKLVGLRNNAITGKQRIMDAWSTLHPNETISCSKFKNYDTLMQNNGYLHPRN